MTGDEGSISTQETAVAGALVHADDGEPPDSAAGHLSPPPSHVDDRTKMPTRLARIADFVNTANLMTSVESLATPRDLHAWLVAHGLLAADVRLSAADLAAVIAVREALRELIEGNAGHPTSAGAIAVLARAAGEAPVSVAFAPDGEAAFEPAASGINAAFGRLFADIATAMADGTWARLKACRNDECRWAYYDASKNRSARWCSMAGCGNRMKGRAYRRRARSGVSA